MIALLRYLFVEDLWLKLFSLALAVLIWVTVTFISQKDAGIEQRVVSRKLPVTILSSAEDIHNFRVSPREVMVTLQGNPRVLQNLQTNDVRAIVDLTGVGTARDLRKRIEVSVPPGISQVRVTPEEVQVVFPPDR
jgi:YbbR domain-containing protein